MNKCKVSIIIPVYNAGKYLRECLDSVFNQSLKDIEVICINDGSTDNSFEILKEYDKKYNNMILINQKNSGVIKTRIIGLEKASGKYVGWVDADDFVDKDMFKKLYDACNTNNADVALCNYNFFPNDVLNKKKWFKPYKGKVTWQFINQNTIQWNKIVKRELLEKINIEELFNVYGEGSYAFVLINAKKIISIDNCLYNYRVGHTSLSSNFNNVEWFKKTMNINFLKINYVKKNNYGIYWENYFTYLFLYYALILMIVSAYNERKDYYYLGQKEIKKYNLFNGNYDEYLHENFSFFKYLFLKYIGSNSYFFMKLVAKIILK